MEEIIVKMKKITYFNGLLTCLLIFGVLSQMAYALRPTVYPWTMYRHDLAHTASTASSAPNANNTLLWTWSGYYPNAPVVADGRVIVISSQMYALDETTGVQLWGPVSFVGTFYGVLSVVGDRIYIGTSSGYMYCINATNGLKIWEYQIQTPGQIQTSPAVANGKVYFGTTNNYLYALDAITGLYSWRFTAGNSIYYSSPAVDGTWIYFGCDDGKLYALNDTGTLPSKKWDFQTSGQIRSTPLVADGKVFFGSYYTDHSIFAVDKTSGQLIWKFTVTGGYNLDNAPAFSDGLVFFTASNSKAYALYSNATSGLNYTENDPTIQLWSQTLGSSPKEPAVADSKVFTSAGNTLYALNITNGQIIWFYTFASTAYDPIVADGRVFVPHYYGITCFGDPFPPVTYHYAVNAGGQNWDIMLVINATPGALNSSGLMTLKKLAYTLQGISGTTGTSNITIPNALLGGPYTVTVDGGLPNDPPGVIISTNGTHSSLYFAYGHSTHTVEIIGTTVVPEFPTTNLLTILIFATTAASLCAYLFKRNRRLSV
jgi:outer membrane protein assembly factor BamB